MPGIESLALFISTYLGSLIDFEIKRIKKYKRNPGRTPTATLEAEAGFLS